MLNNQYLTHLIAKLDNYEALLSLNNDKDLQIVLLSKVKKHLDKLSIQLPEIGMADKLADKERIYNIIKKAGTIKKSILTMRTQWATGKAKYVESVVFELIKEGRVISGSRLNGTIYTAT